MNDIKYDHHKSTLRVKRLGIDTYREPVIYMRSDCHICRSEGFEARSRVAITINNKTIVATLDVIHGDLINPGEVGLSEITWRLLVPNEGEPAYFSHPDPLTSLGHIRAKIYGHTLSETDFDAIVTDIVKGNYDDVHLSAFITACANDNLSLAEIVSLTKSMIKVGNQLSWDQEIVVDKHCVGGLPGNKTTLIIVPIVAAFGLTMPKTSSRAITSPAGSADTMETLAPVDLSLEVMRQTVNKENGCIAWGGAVHLSPADDILISVERQLDIDSEGQLIASVLSKKAAAGSTHVVIDIPVGPTAKVRSMDTANQLSDILITVGKKIGMNIRVIITDGEQPVGRGIGPALAARDVLAVLQGEHSAPIDLRERSLVLAGELLELSGIVEEKNGYREARYILEEGLAWNKFKAICEAQGGMRELPVAEHRHEILADREGMITEIDNRKLALVAKLAGAPQAPAAGIELQVKKGTAVYKGQPLYTLHAEAPGELHYALDYITRQKHILHIES